MEFLEAMKWEEDWKTTAVDILRSNYEEFYKIEPMESQEDNDTQEDDPEEGEKEEDPVLAAMMKRSMARKAEAKIVDPIEDWLADVTPLGKKMETVDPLAWWWKEKQRGNDRMGLADLALDVFSCPATSVDVERLFSRAGRNVTSLRHNMKARKLAKVVSLGQWFLDDWVPSTLLDDILKKEKEARELARAERKRRRQGESERARKKRKVTPDGDDKSDDE
ncbi:hypothetical protein A4X13_0g7493 [Tilletia indica]|uniref:HAT C-terminal dimerisation domain-containing protein n=1 Tax=Tilletia indica TaxID=43049 RepID=A0A8T8SJ00_9BASI|nr:hypothetical protein A4X13_0g7493 [Tilletia indica]